MLLHTDTTAGDNVSLVLRTIKLLSPCLHKFPEQLEYKGRYIDLIVNDGVLKVRKKMISFITRFLDEKGNCHSL